MNKKLAALTLGLALTLSSCGLMPPDYDSGEYMVFARLETHARFLANECDDSDAVRARLAKMHFDAELLQTYTFFLPRNSDVFEISKIMAEDVREMDSRYADGEAPNITYCKLKSKQFVTKARRALEAVGKLQTVTK